MQTTINFYDVKEEKMPESGPFLVRVKNPHETDLMGSAVPPYFCSVVWGDSAGPMDKWGDLYDYQEFITHWGFLPDFL